MNVNKLTPVFYSSEAATRFGLYTDHCQDLFLVLDLENVLCLVSAAGMCQLWVMRWKCITLLKSIQLEG